MLVGNVHDKELENFDGLGKVVASYVRNIYGEEIGNIEHQPE